MENDSAMSLVEASEEALDLISQIKGRYGDDLIFHQSGGCCDGSAPMCVERKDFPLGDSDQLLGEIGGIPFYMGAKQFERWAHTRLTIEVVKGNGGMFSLDNGTGKRFITRSIVCTV